MNKANKASPKPFLSKQPDFKHFVMKNSFHQSNKFKTQHQ